jgi:hypothetical protein
MTWKFEHTRPNLTGSHTGHGADRKGLILEASSEVLGRRLIHARAPLGSTGRLFFSFYNALDQVVDVFDNRKLLHRSLQFGQGFGESHMVGCYKWDPQEG